MIAMLKIRKATRDDNQRAREIVARSFQDFELEVEFDGLDFAIGSIGTEHSSNTIELVATCASANGPAVKLSVSVVQMTLRSGDKASLETQWRITDARRAKEEVSGATFSSPLRGKDYAGVAQAVSECLALLADRLVAQIPLE